MQHGRRPERIDADASGRCRNDDRIVPGRTIRADLDREIIAAGQAEFGAPGKGGLKDEAGRGTRSALIDRQPMVVRFRRQ
jgi:hypothetical protein